MKRYIRSSAEIAWMVTYGWDEGGPESGPIWGSDRWLIYARSENEACRKFEAEYADSISGYEGCWAEPATPEDIAEWEAGENWEEELPFSSTRTKKRSIKAAKKICASEWPEELTYDDYPEGDQIIEGLIQAVDYLDIFEEPSTQGGVGSDFFFTSDGEELGSIDIQEEEEILSDLYHSSKSKEDYHKKVKIWLANFLNL